MFDILVYLFKNYYTPQACPTADVLAKRLAAAGFEYDDIDEAIRWLLGLAETTENCVNLAQTQKLRLNALNVHLTNWHRY